MAGLTEISPSAIGRPKLLDREGYLRSGLAGAEHDDLSYRDRSKITASCSVRTTRFNPPGTAAPDHAVRIDRASPALKIVPDPVVRAASYRLLSVSVRPVTEPAARGIGRLPSARGGPGVRPNP